MQVLAKEQVKSLLAAKGMTLKDLSALITEKSGKNCSSSSLSKKLTRGTISYNDVVYISNLLGYQIKFDYVE